MRVVAAAFPESVVAKQWRPVRNFRAGRFLHEKVNLIRLHREFKPFSNGGGADQNAA